MTIVEYVSLYDLRVKLVQDALTKNPKLDDNASHELAVQVPGRPGPYPREKTLNIQLKTEVMSATRIIRGGPTTAPSRLLE